MTMVCYGQSVDSLSYRIHFAQNSSALDVERPDNSSALSCFANDLDSLHNAAGVSVLEISVRGWTSWEGSYIGNQYLGRVRARVLAGYLTDSLGVNATQTESCLFGSDIFDYVSKSGSVYSHEVLSILKNSDSDDRKIRALKELDSGHCWEWLRSAVFPKLRRADIVIRYCVRDNVAVVPVVYAALKEEGSVLPAGTLKTEVPAQTPESAKKEESVLTAEPVQTGASVRTAVPVKVEEPVRTVAAAPADTVESKSSFFLALKNNVIYDAALVANLGLEISLGKHFSLDLPFTFSPYDIRDDYRMRTLSVQPELRYYFKRGGKGHFLGIHGNLAYYNAVTPLNARTRYQDRDGEHPLYGGGISYGYSLPFGKYSSWGMEFTIGAGYAYLDYDCFYNVNNGAWFNKDTKHYFGIDKAGITIYCRIADKNRKKK